MASQNEQVFSVLLVEKDNATCHFIKKSLEEDKQFPSVVDHASNAKDALEKLSRSSYHVLLVEAELDGKSGLDLLDQLRRQKLPLPFVLMTSMRDEQLASEARKRGAAELIVKNESHFQELSGKLRNCYRKYHQSKPSGKKVHQEKIKITSDKPEMETASSNGNGRTLSIYDDLTGLYNHSYLHDRLVREFASATRYHYPLSCLMIDMDHFKAVNEEFGYQAGEELLKECAALLFENCRLSDLIARFGGEEFAIVLPHVSYEGAQELAERLRLTFAEHRFLKSSKDINLTISLGVASFPEDPVKHRAELLNFASQALSRSKASGRNRVSFFRDIQPIFGDMLPDFKISEDKILDFQRRMTEIADIARRSYIEASKALIIALESKDRFTAGHAASCAKYCVQVAEAMGLSVEDAEVIQHGALLHDIGKICIPDEVLLKPGRLTLEEFEKMKQHAYFGYKILKPIQFLNQEAIMVLHHHEWFNGEGYPCKLKGDAIPLGARIISVIDSYDTMRIAGGRYKKTCTVESAVNELISCSGTQFDPEVVKAFISVLKARRELTTDNYNHAQLEEILRSSKANLPKAA